MPTIFIKNGFRFYFYSNEGTEPPHVHVTGKGGEMKIWLKPILVDVAFRVSPKDQKLILSIIKENHRTIVEEWNEFAAKKK